MTTDDMLDKVAQLILIHTLTRDAHVSELSRMLMQFTGTKVTDAPRTQYAYMLNTYMVKRGAAHATPDMRPAHTRVIELLVRLWYDDAHGTYMAAPHITHLIDTYLGNSSIPLHMEGHYTWLYDVLNIPNRASMQIQKELRDGLTTT